MAKDNHKAPPVAEAKIANRQKVDFPRDTLQESLRVPQALEDANGGQPMPPMDVAIAMGFSPGSQVFRNLVSSSLRYGLTTGVHTSLRVSIEPLGQDIVRPQSQEQVNRAMVTAALTPEVFHKIYDFFRDKKLPEARFFQNTVNREFNIPKELTELCVNNFVANMEFVGLVRTVGISKWLSAGAPVAPAITSGSEQSAETNDAEVEDRVMETSTTYPETQKPPTIPPVSPPVKNAIFVGHGKNKVPLEQLKAILNQYAIPHKIAIEEANSFRPISQKVAEIMQSCGAGILIFTADEEFQDKDGNAIWRPSENVVFELGAASMLYEQRVIIFKEKAVTFPSNFKDIGYIEFDKDALGSKTNELFKELIDFGLIKVTVGA